MVERINVWSGRDGQQIELVGDIVKLVTLPGGNVPAPFESSAKVVAGARNHLDLQLKALLEAVCLTNMYPRFDSPKACSKTYAITLK